MNPIAPIPHEGPTHPASATFMPHIPDLRQTDLSAADRVELSDASAAEAHAEARIAEIRARIADDTYLTPEKLEVAVAGLLRDALREW